MSQANQYKIDCPNCACTQDVLLYESINVADTPELRDKLMTNQLNVVQCTECTFSFRVEKPLLYHDSENGFMLYYFPASDNDHEEGQRQFRDAIGAMNSLLPEDLATPQVHLVFSRTELVERIFYLEEGLDERLIEYVKYMIYVKNLNQIPPAGKAILYDAEDSTDEALCFVVQDLESKALESMLQYNREAYNALSEMFDRDEMTANLFELFPGPYISARHVLLSEDHVPDQDTHGLG